MIKLLTALATMEQGSVKKALYTALLEMIALVFDSGETLRISATEPTPMAMALVTTIPAPPIAAPQPVVPLDSDCVVSSHNNHWKRDQWQPRKKIEDRKDNPKSKE